LNSDKHSLTQLWRFCSSRARYKGHDLVYVLRLYL